MEPIQTPSPEEMQAMIDKAKRDLEAALAKMTPEERARAEQNMQKAVADDRAAMQALTDRAKEALAGSAPTKAMPKFCPNCGAPVRGGKFCTDCGSPLI